MTRLPSRKAKKGLVPIEPSNHDLMSLSRAPSPFDGRVLISESKMGLRVELPIRRSSEGIISKLPLDVLWLILSLMDVVTLNRMRLLNYAIKMLVENFRPYRYLIELVPEALQSLLVCQVLRNFTVAHLFDALTSRNCWTCGKAGLLLFIPLGRRCCMVCVQSSPSLRLLSVVVAKDCFGLSDDNLSMLPVVQMPIGRFGWPGREYRSQQLVVSLGLAHRLALKIHGSEEKIRKYIAPAFNIRYNDYLLRVRDWQLAQLAGQIRAPPSIPRSRDEKLEVSYVKSVWRVVTPFPCANMRKIRTEFPRMCLGCIKDMKDFHAKASKSSVAYKERELQFIARAATVWWVEGFSHHVHGCPGIRSILEEED
ncbi:hypothetical protein FQN57_002217 [Myotisia sp. PD_48]|nr:hypothetical protein FQN57_002217 [Myotisia sp. PD_48]